ncbi:extensin family protein [uncultured Hyphomicrobium sp.]|uniref:extensin-like domain-containing protein n=1 Tax=uncultured Hyphomicrobium sp. TaxID=194373 RepID=UPI0025CE418C|nr:extensin family protein [uncultured Hyphomicrobium sp.]
MSLNPVRIFQGTVQIRAAQLCAGLLWAGVAVSSVGIPVSSARADDASSLSESVTGAFETIVIDAKTAASKATAAAQKAAAAAGDAITNKAANKKSKKSKKDAETAKGDGAKGGSAKGGAAKSDAYKADSAAAGGDTGKAGAVPAAASADKAKPSDGKQDTPTAKAADGKAGAPATVDPKGADPKGADPKAADAKAADPKAKDAGPPTEWPAVEVELARARCTQLLKGVDAVTVPEAPFRKGDCGTMAPVRLISIGKSPEITFSPQPVVTCDLVLGLVKWMKNEVQPAARKHLKAEVVRVDSMSDYSCRMAYGRVGNKLSEHGKANALDIRSFVTRKGDEAVVLSDWGQTKRDVRKQIAAAKAAAEKAEAVKIAAEKAAKERAEAAEFAAKSETTGTPLPRKSLVEGLPPRKDDTSPLAVPASVNQNGPLADVAATRLGGPLGTHLRGTDDDKSSGKKKRKDAKKNGKDDGTVAALPGGQALDDVVAPPPSTPAARFLHDVHAAGCRIFGTTLGPEANEAHRNHFHVDMAERKVRKICD